MKRGKKKKNCDVLGTWVFFLQDISAHRTNILRINSDVQSQIKRSCFHSVLTAKIKPPQSGIIPPQTVLNGHLTNELCRFIWSFVYEGLKGLLHGIDKLLILQEADVYYVIHFVLEVQELLHHGLIFLGVDDYSASKGLRNVNSHQKQNVLLEVFCFRITSVH